MKKQSPVQRIWALGKEEHGRLITSVVLAVMGAAGGILPYFAAAKLITRLLAGETALSAYAPWLLLALGGYLVRTALYNRALSISHRTTFSTLKSIRETLLAKLPRLPLGTVMDTSSGKLKEIIVDQVVGMETTLAHLFPEMTANIVAPLLTVVYLFVLDWRMALLSLAVFPVAFVFMMMVMGNYAGRHSASNPRESVSFGRADDADSVLHGVQPDQAVRHGRFHAAHDRGGHRPHHRNRTDAPHGRKRKGARTENA